jgi:hypothetical protein
MSKIEKKWGFAGDTFTVAGGSNLSLVGFVPVGRERR